MHYNIFLLQWNLYNPTTILWSDYRECQIIEVFLNEISQLGLKGILDYYIEAITSLIEGVPQPKMCCALVWPRP